MTSVPNWRIRPNDDGTFTVDSYWRDSDPAQPVPPALRPYIKMSFCEGRMNGMQSFTTKSSYTHVSFPIKKVSLNPAIKGFVNNDFKGVSLVFGYKNRAQNPKYPIQKEDEIAAMLNIS